MKSSTAALLLLMLFSSSAMAVSVIRVQCPSDAEGAKIFVNGEFKGHCPTDLFISSGEKTLRAVKPVDEERERVFETRFTLVPDASRRIRVELSQPQLTAEAKSKIAGLAREKAEQGDTSAMRELAGYYREGRGVPKNPDAAKKWDHAAKALDEKREAEKILARAENGDKEAMAEIAERYESGVGVEQDRAKAEQWRERTRQAEAEATRQRAEGGDTDAMRTLATYYAEGRGLEKNPEKAQAWVSRADKADTKAREESEREQRIADKAARDARLQKKIDDTVYLETTRKLVADNFNRAVDPFGFLAAITLSPLPTASGLVADAFSDPTKSTQVALWKRRMSSRAAIFDNPDSMIARAYSDQHIHTD